MVEREEAFLELLATHGPRLRGIAWSYARGTDREDLHQEILCQLWRSLPSFRGDAGLGTWVYRVALNTALTWTRNRRRRPVEVQPAAEAAAHPTSAGDSRRQDAILEEFLELLGETDRSLLILYLEGLRYEQMSEVTGLSLSGVGVRLHRIKSAYRRRFLEGEP